MAGLDTRARGSVLARAVPSLVDTDSEQVRHRQDLIVMTRCGKRCLDSPL